MSHGDYVLAAFGVTALGLLWIILSSYLAMRRSEALADDLRQLP